MPNVRQNIRIYAFSSLQSAYIAAEKPECKQKAAPQGRSKHLIYREKTGAGEGIRTLDPNLGKVVLYP